MAKNEKERTVFKVDFEGKPSGDIRLMAFAFDSAGILVDSAAPSPKGQEFVFSVSPKEMRRLRVFIAPVPPKELDLQISLETMHRLGAYEPAYRIDPEHRIMYNPIPEVIWGSWMWALCRVRGKVLKPINVDGTTKNFPVCGARVHICEVDKIRFLIPRIPDDIIIRLRDDILNPPKFKVPKIPIPGPFPDPPIGGLPPIPRPLPFNINKAEIINPISASILPSVSRLTAVPKALQDLKGLSTKSEILALSSSRIGSMEKIQQLPVLNENIKSSLFTDSPNLLRKTFVDNFGIFFPYFCILDWVGPYFFTCQELAVVETDANGRFDTYITYRILGDKPDLYFWVEYNIDGVWTTVYKPPKACNTYWNYNCGTEVTILVTDPRVRICGELPSPLGLVVNIYKIGSSGYVSHVNQADGNTNINGVNQKNIGLTNLGIGSGEYMRPFGASLGMVVHFGTQLIPNGITHYKWSYRKLKDNNLVDLPNTLAGGIPNPEKAWKEMSVPVSITYREENRNVFPPKVSLKPYPLGPDSTVPGVLFKIPYRHPDLVPDLPVIANVDRDWVSLDFASSILDSTFGSNTPATAASNAGLYEFKFEMYKITAGAAQKVSLSKGVFQHPDPGNVSEFIPAPNVNLVIDPADSTKAMGYKMLIRIDNNRCTADLKEVNVNGVLANPACGFVPYEPGDNAVLSFEASHPNGFATFSMHVVRGSGNTIAEATDGGHVIASSTDYTLASGLFRASIPTATLLQGCSQAAFAESLYVNALATNGSYDLDGYDASDLEAFALELKDPTP